MVLITRCNIGGEDEELFKFIRDVSEETNREVGAAYCQHKNGNVYAYKLCLGDRCRDLFDRSVTIEPCKSGEKHGDVHSHTVTPIPSPSFGDIELSIMYQMNRSCIVASSSGRYACIIGFDKLKADNAYETKAILRDLRIECNRAEYAAALDVFQKRGEGYQELVNAGEKYYRCLMDEIPRRTKLKVCEGHVGRN